jgi:Ala-tRNA(Pro) deacylase
MSEHGSTPSAVDTEPARQRLFALLDELGIETSTHSHAPVFTVEENRAARGALPGAHCKSLFLKDKKGVEWLVVAREDRALDMKALAGVIGSARLSFGSADRLGERLGVIPGAVSPLALINDISNQVRVVLDADVMAAEIANFHPLTNDATTAIAPDDLARFIAGCGNEARVIDLTPATRTADI